MTSQLPPIYVISLVRETARRENIKQRLTALGANYEFFNAVDGKALQPSQYTHRMQTRHHFLKEGFEMTSGEIGCFMSHHNLWQKIADGKNEYALVLEDDAVWDNDFADVINQVLTCKWHWEVVLLSEYTSTTAGRVLCNLGDNRQLIRRHRRAFTSRRISNIAHRRCEVLRNFAICKLTPDLLRQNHTHQTALNQPDCDVPRILETQEGAAKIRPLCVLSRK